MNKKLERVWKEAVMKCYLEFALEGGGWGEAAVAARKKFRANGLRVQIWTHISLTGKRIPNQPNATLSLHIHSLKTDEHFRANQNSFLFQKRVITLSSLSYRLSVKWEELITHSSVLTFCLLNPVTLRSKMQIESHVGLHSHSHKIH